jgi:hypothetical protein
MQHMPSSEANRLSTSQISRILWNPKFLDPISQKPATCPYPEPNQSSSCPDLYSLKINKSARHSDAAANSKSEQLLALCTAHFVAFLRTLPGWCFVLSSNTTLHI